MAAGLVSLRPTSDHVTVDATAQATRRDVRWVAVAAVTVVVAASAGIAALHWLNRGAGVSTWWLGNLTIGAGLGVFGGVLAHRLPSNPIGWLMIVGGVWQSLSGIGREWAVYATVTRPNLPGAGAAALVGSAFWTVSIATLPLVLLVFPDGRLTSRRWRVAVGVVVAATIVGSVTAALVPGEFTEEMPALVNPIGVDSPVIVPLTTLAQVALMLGILAAVVSFVRRLRGATGVLRQQMRWILFSGTLLGIEAAVELIPVRMPMTWSDWMSPVLLLFFLFSITVSVLRWRLWNIDVLISRSLVYGTLTVLLGGAFVGIVAISGRFRRHPVDYSSSLLAAAVVAVAFAPLRDHLQRRIDRRVYGDRSDPYRAVTRLGDQLGATGSDGSVLAAVVDAVATSLRLDHVAIVAADGTMMAAAGTGGDDGQSIPLLFRTARVGTLVVAHRAGNPLGRREREVLDDLAPLVAAVVQAVAVSAALQRSRLALVTAREEERRRIRRDLHDGLGPALAAVRMKLDGASTLVDVDPPRAKAVLDQLADDIRATIADIRVLVYDLRPPALDELGLVPALRELARSFSGPTDDGGFLGVELAAPDDLSTLPAAYEVAVYRIVSEGLTNVVRHAGATHCRVGVGLRDGHEIVVQVDDDGVGLGADGDRQCGIGTMSMIERAAELGGDCHLERSPLGGTRISAVLPTGVPILADEPHDAMVHR